MDHRTEILDLRTALEVLRQTPGQLVETRVEVDPAAELSGVYRHVGAGGTVMRPTTVDGPAMLFHNVKGHPGCPLPSPGPQLQPGLQPLHPGYRVQLQDHF